MKYCFVLILTIIPFIIFAQDQGVIEGTIARKFVLEDESGAIEFIKTDTTFEKKPVLLFCQGSLPRPLMITLEDGRNHFSNYVFDYKLLSEQYHLVQIAMPFTPVVCNQSELNTSMCYVPNVEASNEFDLNYQKANYLANYVDRASKVVDFLVEQPWVDVTQVVVLGHSQGSKVAVKLANKNKRITKLGFFGGNTKGRYDQFIREYRLKEEKGEISSEDAQEKIDELYERWKNINENVNGPILARGDSSQSTISFSENFEDDLLSLDIPVYVAYGSRDIIAINCDVLPLLFISEGKENLTMKSYPGLGHNFEKIDKDGKSNYEEMYWQQVVDEFVEWLKE